MYEAVKITIECSACIMGGWGGGSDMHSQNLMILLAETSVKSRHRNLLFPLKIPTNKLTYKQH